MNSKNPQLAVSSEISIDLKESGNTKLTPGPINEVLRDQSKIREVAIEASKVSENPERVLSAEVAEKLIETLKARFLNKEKHYKNPEGIKWEDVQNNLKSASPESLWALNQMVEPDVVGYDEKKGKYRFNECSEETPDDRRECVYDKEAEDSLKKKYPNERYNGNAIDMAAEKGIEVLDEKEWLNLQILGRFNEISGDWIKTPNHIRETGMALRGLRLDPHFGEFPGDVGLKNWPDDYFEIGITDHNADIPGDRMGWRGGLSV